MAPTERVKRVLQREKGNLGPRDGLNKSKSTEDSALYTSGLEKVGLREKM